MQRGSKRTRGTGVCRFVMLRLTPLLLAWLAGCRESTTPELNRMDGRIDGQSFAGTASANIHATSGATTLYIWGHRQDVEETIALRIPWDPEKVGTPVQIEATVIHTVGGDGRIGQYDGTGTLTLSDAGEMVAGTFQFDAQSTYGSQPRYGPAVSFSGGRFRARLYVYPEP